MNVIDPRLDPHPACDPANLFECGHVRAHHSVQVDPSITPEIARSPKFWRHVKTLKVNDVIEVFNESFDALLRVTVAGDSLVVVRELRCWRADAAHEAKTSAQFKAKPGKRVEFRIGKKRWVAINDDGSEHSSGHATREAAEQALGEAA
jgi:hypothetical protein